MKRQGMFVGDFEFNSYGRLMWMLPEIHYTPKRYHLKQALGFHGNAHFQYLVVTVIQK